jgi:hypothetical protein
VQQRDAIARNVINRKKVKGEEEGRRLPAIRFASTGARVRSRDESHDLKISSNDIWR